MTVQLNKIKPYITAKEFVTSFLEGRGYEFNRSGFTTFRGEKTPSVSIRKDGHIKDFGGDFSGDLIDFLEQIEGMRKAEAINLLGEMVGASDIPAYTAAAKEPTASRRNDRELIEKLNNEAKRYIRADVPVVGSVKKRIEAREIPLHTASGIVDTFTFIPTVFDKLFEGVYLHTKAKYMDYIFNNIVGYSDFFQCPVIVIRDTNGDAVDIAHYRPVAKDGKKLPKYLYKANAKKPYKRGVNFLYPFQREMESIIAKKDFAIVGEGLKNALNALAYRMPYISLEGAGNKPSEKMKAYIQEIESSGKSIVTAFDGDAAGERAYLSFKGLMRREYKNLFTFDSGEDFTTYIKASFGGKKR